MKTYPINSLSISEVQNAAFRILVELDSICKERGLLYSLTYGTLIGAVRHKGFIPWDDDVDILMPRKDFEALKKYFENTYTGKLKWCDRRTVENYPYCISRVSDMRYRYYTNVNNQKDFDIGVFVDIYPLDNYCDTKSAALKLGRKIWFKNRLFDMYLNPDKTKGTVKKIIRNIMSLILHLVHGNQWHFYIDAEIQSIIVKHTNTNNEIVGVISQYEWKELMRREWFEKYIEVEFENHVFMICEGYHELLTSIYGDYMKLPDEDKRIPTHNYTIVTR
ncbi:LicD family protein [Lachnospiraceae bacterium 45-P1]